MIRLMSVILALGAIGFASLPARSDEIPAGDTAVIQETTQDAIITGNGNYTEQNSSQINRRQRRETGNAGTVQRSNQAADVQGNGNDTIQDVEQVNEDREGRRSRTPR